MLLNINVLSFVSKYLFYEILHFKNRTKLLLFYEIYKEKSIKKSARIVSHLSFSS